MSIKFRSLVFILVLLAVTLFAVANWPLFLQRSPINLLLGVAVVPFGLVMLAILGVMTLLYLIFLAKVETESLVGSRRANKEVEDARKLALSAEESRLNAFREDVEQRLETLDEKVSEILRRVDAQGRVIVRKETVAASEPSVADRGDAI